MTLSFAIKQLIDKLNKQFSLHRRYFPLFHNKRSTMKFVAAAVALLASCASVSAEISIEVRRFDRLLTAEVQMDLPT
jgi:hypothetical protein